MSREYKAQCKKCDQQMGMTTTARNKDRACENLQDDIKQHDILLHGDDGKWPKFVIERVRR